ncbi:MAG: NAD(P)H-dependent oxidoreductase [Bacteroides sp.]|nr:NAD(P)H-dependent oxidoreductase [Bacteroides sp.]
MKGKNIFTTAEYHRLRELIVERNNTPSDKQLPVRNKMRAIGFYGRDDWGIVDMQVEDLDSLIAEGKIIIQDNVRIAVLYHSVSGTTKRIAEAILHGINSVDGAEGRTFPIDEPDAEYVRESRCVILGTPVYYASMSGEIKMWFEKAARPLGMTGKLAGAFATADYVHGGREIAI